MNRLQLCILLIALASGLFMGCKRNASVKTNVSPVANAGPDQELAFAGAPLAVTLDGSGSDDPDGTIAAYIWMSNDPAVADHPGNVMSPSVNLGMGLYRFTLWVRDNSGHTSDPDTVVIAVGVPIDQPPPGDTPAGDGGAAAAYAPDATCLALSARPDGPCKDCECTPNAMGGCAEELSNCLDNADETYQMQCTAVYDCSVTNACSGGACFTPCMAEITTAANGDPAGMCVAAMPELSACSGASAVSTCRTTSCMAACM